MKKDKLYSTGTADPFVPGTEGVDDGTYTARELLLTAGDEMARLNRVITGLRDMLAQKNDMLSHIGAKCTRLEKEREGWLQYYRATKDPSDPCRGDCKGIGRCPHDPVCNE